MDISNLEPCSTYIVGVSSVDVFLEPGETANVTHTTSSEWKVDESDKIWSTVNSKALFFLCATSQSEKRTVHYDDVWGQSDAWELKLLQLFMG